MGRRTRPTTTTSVTGTGAWGTSSGFGGENFQGPKMFQMLRVLTLK
jgi:hypothetical protein